MAKAVGIARIVTFLLLASLALGRDNSTIIHVEDGAWNCGRSGTATCLGNATSTKDGRLKLTPTPNSGAEFFNYTAGMALSTIPVALIDDASNRPASLNFTFSFLMEAGNSPGPGDGMAFVLLPTSSPVSIGDNGHRLGVYDIYGFAKQKTFAVEFDTFKNFYDIDNRHVGIDTISYVSLAAATVPQSVSLVGRRVYAWVDYDALRSVVEIRVDNAPSRPSSAILQYTIDLFEVLYSKQAYVGFSAANGDWVSFYTVFDLTVDSVFVSRQGSDGPVTVPTQSHGSSASSTNVGVIAGAAVSGIVFGLILGGILIFLRNRSKKQEEKVRLDETSSAGPSEDPRLSGVLPSMKAFTYKELCAATNNFSDALKLGAGGGGSVYHGFIPGLNSGAQVAVKRVSSESKQAEKQFLAEVLSISSLRHRHVVQLLGWCNEGHGKFLLVYEYMQNRSLDRHLFPAKRGNSFTKPLLSWKLRFKILGQLAAALHYLHTGWRQQVIHRDVKSSNVMLDEKFNAMLGDFGLARMSDHFKNPSTTGVAGTFGYIAPEVSGTGKYTSKSDVFAFGAVCLEVVCGRRAHDGKCSEEDILLVNIVWRKLREDQLLSVVDQRLHSSGLYNEEEVRRVLLLGLACSHPEPSERPTMQKVVDIIAGEVELPPIPRVQPRWNSYMYPYDDLSRRLSVRNTRDEISDEVGILRNRSEPSHGTWTPMYSNASQPSYSSAP